MNYIKKEKPGAAVHVSTTRVSNVSEAVLWSEKGRASLLLFPSVPFRAGRRNTTVKSRHWGPDRDDFLFALETDFHGNESLHQLRKFEWVNLRSEVSRCPLTRPAVRSPPTASWLPRRPAPLQTLPSLHSHWKDTQNNCEVISTEK